MTTRGGLHNNTNDTNHGSSNERFLSAPFIGTWGGYQGTEETSSLEGGDDVGRQICLTNWAQTFQSICAIRGEVVLDKFKFLILRSE
jgi:hypothetical protein